MTISNQKNTSDIKLRDSVLTKGSTIPDIKLDQNLTFSDCVKKFTTKTSKSAVTCWRNGEVGLTILWCITICTYALLAWGTSGRTNVAKIECAHRRARKLLIDYNPRFLTFHSIYGYFALFKAFNTKTFNFHQYFKAKFSSHQRSHICTTPYTEKIVILKVHCMIIQKLKNVICTK